MKFFTPSADIARALKLSLPIVALESTVVTHGLPHPENLYLARDMESAVRDEGATPATIAILNGQVRVGLIDSEVEELSKAKAIKVSRRDFATAIVKKSHGGTTVAGTMLVAQQAGIQVFATGGIGGVHRESPFDISADLQALADTPMIVVCAGAKAILDLPATLEYLETMSVPVVGYQTEDFPAFYSRESGLKISAKLESPEEIAAFAQAHWGAGMKSAVLVTNPVPAAVAIPKAEMDPFIAQASQEAVVKNIRGQALTPFLLQRISELTGSRSMRVNLALLLNNARLAAQIARALTARKRTRAL
ncbi:MAG: pseudouridine-5'-phosphate glycosidase [Chloroflexi bacterium]|nr:pseudouridine-5'-phosphate glycosidase [Chloroflexota bacterium]